MTITTCPPGGKLDSNHVVISLLSSDDESDMDDDDDDKKNSADKVTTSQSSLTSTTTGASTNSIVGSVQHAETRLSSRRSIPLLSTRSKECWVCSVALELPVGQFCWYTPHAHPLFPPLDDDDEEEDCDDSTRESRALMRKSVVNVCSVCAEDLVNNDDNAMSSHKTPTDVDDDNDDNDEISGEKCAMCLKSMDENDQVAENFFLCDSCPRSFCDVCIATCHGGGDKGYATIRQLENSKEKWSCPVCELPAPLHQQNCDEPTERTLETVLEELQIVEEEYQEALEQLEHDDEKLEEIVTEIEQEEGDMIDCDKELELWRHALERHQSRLADTISRLQDELQNVHCFNLNNFYEQVLGQAKPLKSDAYGKVWVQEADRTLDEYYEYCKSLPKEPQQKFGKESYEDVEDLKPDDCSEDPTNWKPKAEGFEAELPFCHGSDDEREAFERDQRNLAENGTRVKEVREYDDERSQRRRVPEFRAKSVISQRRLRRRKKKKNASGGSQNKDSTQRNNNTSSGDDQKGRHTAGEAGVEGAFGGEESGKPKASGAQDDMLPPTTSEEKDDERPPTIEDGNGDRPPTIQEQTDETPATTPRQINETPTTAQQERKHDSPSGTLSKTAETSRRASDTALTRPYDNPPSRAKASVQNHVVNSTSAYRAVGEARKRIALQAVRRQILEHEIHDAPQETHNGKLPPHFHRSPLVLTGSKLAVSRELAKKLKPHQKEAVLFMWRNAFADKIDKPSEAGGCLLAHNMGLGKSFSVIALIQAAVIHKLVRKVLLVVPVNTLENWKNEFQKWIGTMKPSIDVDCFHDAKKQGRISMVKRWDARGGVLLTSSKTLTNFMKGVDDGNARCIQASDILIIDEAHDPLKGKGSERGDALNLIATKRRILLTGTPIQNK